MAKASGSELGQVGDTSGAVTHRRHHADSTGFEVGGGNEVDMGDLWCKVGQRSAHLGVLSSFFFPNNI